MTSAATAYADGLLELVDRFPRLRIIVVGDVLADEFIYGQISRVSREAPVLILRYDTTEVVPGGAGNAANNVAALGARVRAVGVVGRDDPGSRAVAAFHPRVDRRGIARVAEYRTPTKTRILAGGIHSAKQQVVRIDREPQSTAGEMLLALIGPRLDRALESSDAILFSDYGYGLISAALVDRVRSRLSTDGRRVPVLVDSRHALLAYSGLTASTPNESEVEQQLGVRIGDDSDVLEQAGRTLLKRTGMQAVLITRGSRGMALFEPRKPTVHIPISGTDQIADVTGAGDTVIATMTLALAAGGTFEQAALLANYAGGIVVMKRGTATVSADELRAAILHVRTKD